MPLESLTSNVHLSDVPKALFIHECLGLSLFFGAFAVCYRTQPTIRIYHSKLGQKYSKKFAKQFPDFTKSLCKNYKQASTGIFAKKMKQYVSRLPHRLRPEARHLEALGESAVARKLMIPFTVPGKIWLTLLALSYLKGPSEVDEQHDERSERKDK